MIYLISLINTLDRLLPNWRSDHLLVLDNCPAHVGKLTQRVLLNLSVPHMYTAPASYPALAVEAMFARIKMLDLSPIDMPLKEGTLLDKHDALTNKQAIMIKVGDFLVTRSNAYVKQLFAKQIINLE